MDLSVFARILLAAAVATALPSSSSPSLSPPSLPPPLPPIDNPIVADERTMRIGAFVSRPNSRAFFCSRPNYCDQQLQHDEYKQLFAIGEFPEHGPLDGRIASAGRNDLRFLDETRNDWATVPLNASSHIPIHWRIEYPMSTIEPERIWYRFEVIPFKSSYDQRLPITRDVMDFARRTVYHRHARADREEFVLQFRKTPRENYMFGERLEEARRYRSLLSLFSIRYRNGTMYEPITAYQVIDYIVMPATRVTSDSESVETRRSSSSSLLGGLSMVFLYLAITIFGFYTLYKRICCFSESIIERTK